MTKGDRNSGGVAGRNPDDTFAQGNPGRPRGTRTIPSETGTRARAGESGQPPTTLAAVSLPREPLADNPPCSSCPTMNVSQLSVRLKSYMPFPSKYSPNMAEAICDLIAAGKSIVDIAKLDGMPSTSTVYRWLAKDPEFLGLYQQAREQQADLYAAEIIEIADDARNDWMERGGGEGDEGWQFNGEHVQRSKLRIDARKWIASKLKPKKYGDRQTVDLNHGVQEMSDAELDARARQLAERLGVELPKQLITPKGKT